MKNAFHMKINTYIVFRTGYPGGPGSGGAGGAGGAG